MRRGVRINLALAAIVAALSAIAYREVRVEVDAREPALSALDADTVERIGVRCTRCVARAFVRSNGRWKMREPYALDADEATIARLIGIAASPVRQRHAPRDFDLARIGLSPPLMTLELDALTLEIGLTDALRGDRYVRVGDEIAMVPDRFSPFLMATPESELDRHLLPRDAGVIDLRIDGVASAQRAGAWRDAMALKVDPVDPAARLRGEPVRVVVTLDDQQRIAWELRRVADGYVARRELPALDYVLDASQFDALIGHVPDP